MNGTYLDALVQRVLILTCTLLASIAFGSSVVCAAALSSGPGLLIVIADTLDVTELASDSTWQQLINQGAYGLMNTRTAGRVTAASTHLTLGSGVRAEAPSDAGQLYNIDEQVSGVQAGALYRSLTGKTPTANSVVHIGMGRLLRQNTGARSGAPIGWLGNQLQKAAVSVCLLGNSDTVNEPRRNGALLLMDSNGKVPCGVVSRRLLQTDASFPFRLRTDYTAMKSAVTANTAAQVVVVELGDLSRLDAYRDYLTDAAWLQQRQRALHTMGEFITQLRDFPGLKGRSVLIISPTPRADKLVAGQWLTPILLLGKNTSSTLLYSQGTRRPGVVLGVELAHAIVAIASSGSAGSAGTLRTFATTVSPLEQVTTTYNRIVTLHGIRAPVLQTYVVYSIGVFLAAWPILWLAIQRRFRYHRLWEFLLLSAAAFPLATLLLPLLNIRTIAAALVITSALTALIALLTKGLGRSSTHAFFLLFTATTIALILDILRGSPLISWSVLGYDVIGGARFYGIGNEYGGVLLTSAVMAVGILLHYWPSKSAGIIAAIGLAGTAIVTGAPWWGANNGAAAAAVLGFTLTGFFLSGKPLNWHRVGLAVLLVLVLAAAAIVLDLTFNAANPSHLGLLARQVAQDGLQPVITVAGRKLAMNWKLLKYTIWTKVLVLSLVVSLALLSKPAPWVKQFVGRADTLLRAAKGALVTAMFLLILNDSGVVAAATAMIPVTTFLLYMATRSFENIGH